MADENSIWGQSIGFTPSPSGYAATQGLPAMKIMAFPPTLDFSQRQMIDMPEGYGSEYSGRAYIAPNLQMVYPTIYDGQQHSREEALLHAQQTGLHMGIFHSPEESMYQANPAAMQHYENVVGQYENTVHARPIYSSDGQLFNRDVYQQLKANPKRKLTQVKKNGE